MLSFSACSPTTTHRRRPLFPRLGSLALALVVLCAATALAEQLADASVYRFSLQPLDPNFEEDTSLTIFRGNLTVTVSPPMWMLQFDSAGGAEKFRLVNTRRWPSQPSFNGTIYQSDYATEMSFYEDIDDVSSVYPGCCTNTPFYDEFFLPILQDYKTILFAGKSAIFKTTEVAIGQIDIEPIFERLNTVSQENGTCPLRCYSPVDMMFSMDASFSVDDNTDSDFEAGALTIDGPNWETMKDFLRKFKESFFFSPDLNGARMGLSQFSGWYGVVLQYIVGQTDPVLAPLNAPSLGGMNDIGTATDRFCRLLHNASSSNPEDWGPNASVLSASLANTSLWSQVMSCQDGLNWANSTVQAEKGWAGQVFSNLQFPNFSTGFGFTMVEASLSGNGRYLDYAIDRSTNSAMEAGLGLTSIGQSIKSSADELEANYRGAQQVIITLTDGVQTRGENLYDAVPEVMEQLNDNDSPKVRFISVGVGPSVDGDQLLAIAGNDTKNVLNADDFDQLNAIIPRLLSLSCDAKFDVCQGTCAGLCSPCGDCLCPTCPDLDCRLSLGCEGGICVYADPEVDCCPANIIEACEKRGGVIELSDCSCKFGGSGDDNTASVVGGSVGTLVGIASLLVVILLLCCLVAVVLVTVIILVLKGRAIAAAIASLGANAFGAGGAAANPTYEGMHTDGANPLYDVDEDEGL